MSCKFDEKIIHLYADEELGDTARRRAEQHLSICDECRAKYQAIAAVKEELIASCAETKAPEYLRTRIIASLDSIAEDSDLKLGLTDRFKLMILNLRQSRAVAVSAAFGIVMLMLLFPGEQGLSHMADDFAKEHIAYNDHTDASSFITGSTDEVEMYFYDQLGIKLSIPSSLSGEFNLKGASIFEIDGMKAAHARYSDESMECSLFIFQDPEPGNHSKYTLSASGKEFEISSKDDVNLICWHKGQVAYVLCGCCCFETLTSLAKAGV